ncbi:MAG: amino acid ABC transporter permease [Anaerolineales bacterium]|nr:amino acid ABC transporter permease [Anaerolineales bacterium]
MAEQPQAINPIIKIDDFSSKRRLRDLPWWFFALILIAIYAIIVISTNENYNNAFVFIKIGLLITIKTTLIAYLLAIVFGLLAGLGRISKNVVINNLARLYVELIRGIPILVLIFFIALVGVPVLVDMLNNFGFWLSDQGLAFLGKIFTAVTNQDISMNARAIISLAVTYGAYLAEIFRAGIQSIVRGQTEAARSLGMSYAQSMRYVILPQAIRNVLPALGNDFVAMVKDSSLVSVLAVRDITQVARLYAGSTFRFREAYVTLAVMYLTITVILSMLVQFVERRLKAHD